MARSTTIMEDVLWELLGEEMTNERGLPPGFRFHPTDEELVTFYLAAKVFNGGFSGVRMAEIDLNRCEPWELPDAAKLGEREWYFFTLRDRKYPTGLRTNRATAAGYWKATGKDREVYGAFTGALVGMKKTLVFYKGRAPRGEKTKWVLHEYRLEGELACRHACKEEWVICRIFYKAACEKKIPFFQNGNCLLDTSPPSPAPPPSFPQLGEMQTLESPMQLPHDQLPHYMFPKVDTKQLLHLRHLPPVSVPQPPASAVPTNVDISLLSKSDFLMEAHPVTSELCNSGPPEQAFFGLVDANPQVDPFVVGVLPGILGLSFAGEAVHDLPISWLGDADAGVSGGLPAAPEPCRPLLPWDCRDAQMWQL